MEFLESQHLNFADVGRAPELPGLYSWYYNHVVQKVDMVPDKISRVMNQVVNRAARPAISLAGKASDFELWAGRLEQTQQDVDEEHARRNDRQSAIESWPSEVAMLYNEMQRRINAPIYIGISTNLRTRLDAHRRALEKRQLLVANQSRELVDLSEFEIPVRNFAERAARAEISDIRLSVAVHPVRFGPEVPTESVLQILSSVELTLNRKILPIFGKR